MARHHGPVLVDTNAILECFRVGSWRALSERLQRRDGRGLRDRDADRLPAASAGTADRCARSFGRSLKAVHPVEDAERAVVAVRAPDIALDVGERSLWAHALTRSDAWVLVRARQGQYALRRSAWAQGSAHRFGIAPRPMLGIDRKRL